ncbi:hypothetical protein [Chryseosolibacter indicus]|uniref:Uncharacterized protein n=1 Tax=Chryseosolibacter indicus TaxID=2782351 RepID=A0ABS5VQ90_9BACT|nr:hypothetical protein [Chryseosolibacter indicus]MBT1703600.1 hypothetical protein [Chryseosolibacter indicus]
MLPKKDLMAIARLNPTIKGLQGGLGGIMFRQVRNKTIISAKPSAPKKQSEQQRMNRLKFKEATCYAKLMMKDPQKKAYYQHKAKKMRLPNAYTAAITSYLRKGNIDDVSIRKSNGKGEDSINVKVSKKDFAVNRVRVTVYNMDGTRLLSEMATKRGNGEFNFCCTDGITLNTLMKVVVEIDEPGWKAVRREIIIG